MYSKLVSARAKLELRNKKLVEREKELRRIHKNEITEKEASEIVLLNQHILPAIREELAEIEAQLAVLEDTHEIDGSRF